MGRPGLRQLRACREIGVSAGSSGVGAPAAGKLLGFAPGSWRFAPRSWRRVREWREVRGRFRASAWLGVRLPGSPARARKVRSCCWAGGARRLAAASRPPAPAPRGYLRVSAGALPLRFSARRGPALLPPLGRAPSRAARLGIPRSSLPGAFRPPAQATSPGCQLRLCADLAALPNKPLHPSAGSAFSSSSAGSCWLHHGCPAPGERGRWAG